MKIKYVIKMRHLTTYTKTKLAKTPDKSPKPQQNLTEFASSIEYQTNKYKQYQV